ncbi:MurR/RpiR family transcriptional regulator [Rhizobium tubonense]|uniref:Transcriptional regulator n=1 Tax=Rhizobium tubonense TaxID=484088 RepID=A0A2W4D6H7_9HYPH|nr:MurR/RpiR family transcriptional regulator [Rhizobium tubonense]PZM12954.1 transcriptional regulator [Rhizobium tubonense]
MTQTPLMDAIYKSITTAPAALSRIALYIAREPQLVPNLSIGELASNTDSGQASVVRYCRLLGFQGFREFKIAFTGEIERDKARRVSRGISDDLSLDPAVTSVSTVLMESIAASAELMDLVEIKRLAVKLRVAQRVEIFGVGASSICAEIISHRLLWLGIRVHHILSPSIAYGIANTLDAEALAIGISYSGVTDETEKFLSAAKSSGADSIAITCRSDSLVALSAASTILLSVAGPWPEPGSSRLIPSVVLLSELLAAHLR